MANSKPRSAKKKILIALVVVLLAAGGGGYAYYKKTKDVVITVQTEKVQRRNLTELVVATGKIQPVLMVKISPEVSGEIIDLPVKEGQDVKKGDLLMKIKPDFYAANRNSAEASYKASLAGLELAKANVEKAEAEFKRSKGLFETKLVSDSQYQEAKTALDVARAQCQSSLHQTEVAKAGLARAEEDLSKTTIYSPLDGTVSRLISQKGERVVGTATMAGTDVMTISDLNDMEARVDIGEIDVVLIQPGQVARLEVDSFKDRKFTGEVTEIANTAKSMNLGQQQEATKFEVKIRVKEKEIFRPGMSVTSEIETRYRTNVLTVPIQSVTTRLSKAAADEKKKKEKEAKKDEEDLPQKKTNAKKQDDANKPAEVVFITGSDVTKALKVKRGISDDNYVEITEGVQEGQEVISGGYKAINRELEDGKKIKVDNQPKPVKDEKK